MSSNAGNLRPKALLSTGPLGIWEWPKGAFVYSARAGFRVELHEVGGRRKLTQHVVEILAPNRSELINGTLEQNAQLLLWLDRKGWHEIRRAVYADGMTPEDAHAITFTCDGYVVRVGPRESGRYLYVGISV